MLNNQETNNSFKNSLTVDNSIEHGKIVMDRITHKLVDIYLSQNSHENIEYLTFLTSAIYLTYKKMYPELSIYIPFRIKSDRSFLENMKKEFARNFKTLTPEELSDLENNFSIDKITTDISAATIVLDHIKPSSISKASYATPLIKDLHKKSLDNTKYINDTEDLLADDEFLDESVYYEIKRDLLKRIIDSTYPSFTLERTPTYQEELEGLEKIYAQKESSSNFSTSISPQQYNDLYNLIEDLRSRLSDKLEYEILRETLPTVLNTPLLKEGFKIDSSFVKDFQKPNGFAALYYLLHTPFGDLELQSQSYGRYYAAKKGSAFHSGIKGKEVLIDDFFELSDSNDKFPLDYYLRKLDSIPVDSLISDLEIPKFTSSKEETEFYRTDLGKKYQTTKKVRELESHIKIKDSIIANGIEYSSDTALFGLAKSISPYMCICSSGHTSFSNAGISQKDLISEFSEILRKRDAVTCLGNLLIERLKVISKKRKESDPQYMANRKKVSGIPRDITLSDIKIYLERLHLKDLNEQKSQDEL